jgi:signal transduction histidine kinase/ActR/RegA family two-component response regulator
VRHWFARLPVHRKLVVMALVVTTAALATATAGLVAVDLWRFRLTAADDTTALAAVIAENTAAAVLFQDLDEVRQSLATVRVRTSVRRACLYLPDGALFAGFASSHAWACPASLPSTTEWATVAGEAPVTRNGRVIGRVYVEREQADIWTRIAVAVLTGVGMLLLAGAVAIAIAHPLHRSVSAPIAQLAAAARSIRAGDRRPAFPAVKTGLDEVGDLARALSDMFRRVGEATDELHRRDLEREELLAREREASRLKDEFLAAVSHELRTPLNAILGWAQILGSTTVSDETLAKALASIARNARAQTRVIEDLVDVSRIVTGKLNLRFDPIDLREPLEAAIDVIRPTAHARQIHFEAWAPESPCLVNGDRDRLQQVVWNLLSNAVKFTEPGGSVTVVTREIGSAYEIEVTDTGAGIAPAFLPYVFDRFRQADGSTTREHGGLGLGLAIVKELTALHGGSVEATSAGPGSGSTFKVRLPALIGLRADVTVQAENPVAADALKGVRVLAVDDNQDALDVLAAALRSAGAEVRTAASGAEALEEWDRQPADILLCDLAMPEMDGFDVLRRIREHEVNGEGPTPALAISAHATAQHLARSRRAGFVHHVTKPYRTADLIRAIKGALPRQAECEMPNANH